MDRSREVLGSRVDLASSPYDAARDADALLILTEWEEFANLDLERLRKELRYPIVIDGRNLYDPEVMADRGFTYYSVGRAASHPDGVPAAVLRNGKKA
jgi:UDPglucose 6-dehydrogenase